MSGRIRTVKPELNQLSWFATLTDGAVRMYLGVLGVVDDYGRCPADPAFLAGQIFWGRQRSLNAIGRLLTELEQAGVIRRYKARGGLYLEIRGWFDKGGPLYQQINKPQGERFPAPDRETDRTTAGPDSRPLTGTDPIRSDQGTEPKGNTNAIPVPPVGGPPPTPEEAASARVVLDRLGEAAGPDVIFRSESHERLVVARLRAGCSQLDLRAIVAFCADQWEHRPEMRGYLRPETLFAADKIDKYLPLARGRYAREIREGSEPKRAPSGPPSHRPWVSDKPTPLELQLERVAMFEREEAEEARRREAQQAEDPLRGDIDA